MKLDLQKQSSPNSSFYFEVTDSDLNSSTPFDTEENFQKDIDNKRNKRYLWKRVTKNFQSIASKKQQFVKSIKDLLKNFVDFRIEAKNKKMVKLADLGRETVIEHPTAFNWCPKLRRPVSTYRCIAYCIDGRRVPQKSGLS